MIATSVAAATFGTDGGVTSASQTPAPTTSPQAEAFAVLHLLPTAPDYVIDAVFRAFAKRWHPDRGGDSDTMRQIIAAHEQLTGGDQ